MSFQVSFSQQTLFGLARCCPSTVEDGNFCCIRVGPSRFYDTCAGGPTSFTLLPSVKSTKTLWLSLLELPRLCTSESVQLSVSRLPGLPVLEPWHWNLWTGTQCCTLTFCTTGHPPKTWASCTLLNCIYHHQQTNYIKAIWVWPHNMLTHMMTFQRSSKNWTSPKHNQIISS